jgi:adenylate cyclase
MSAGHEQRKLAAIMFTDMVGYSALSQRDDKLALELLEEHRELLRKIFPKFNGTEIKTIGDAFLVEFNSALEAAQCAIEIQRALVKRNSDVAHDRRIELKIGIHIGDVVHRGGDVYGDGVNIASRIEPLAGAGGICVSMDVERQIRNALEARFEKLAPTELKNISVAMDLFRIVLPWEKKSEVRDQQSEIRKQALVPASRRFALIGGLILLLIISIGWWWTTLPHRKLASPVPEGSQAKSIPEKSVAVLPFENLSSDKENAYFAEGIQDEILTRLSKIAALKVISRTSTQKYKSAPDNLPEIAKQLGVANVLEGSVQKSGDAVRVTVQLIRAITDSHLWAETYDRKLIDTFGVESDVAQKIASSLEAKLTGSEQRAIATRPTENSEAYQFYLKGRFFWNKRTGADLHTAANYFEQAIAADANFAGAYAGLADADLLIPVFGAGEPREFFPKAMAAARRAVELDDASAEGHTALAQLVMFDFKFVESEHEFRRAIELNPNYATAHHWLGNSLLVSLGRFDEAVKEGQRAVELDPLSLIINADLGSTLIIARRYDEAIAQLQRTLKLDGNFAYTHWNLGEALYLKGDLPGAIAEYQRADALDDDPEITALLGAAYAKAGQRDKALECLEKLKQIQTQRFVRNYLFTFLYAALGDNASALNYLEKADNDGETPDTTWMKVDPLFDPLRSEPRFQKLVAKLFPSNLR